jgi:hypothetical protein
MQHSVSVIRYKFCHILYPCGNSKDLVPHPTFMIHDSNLEKLIDEVTPHLYCVKDCLLDQRG